MENSRLPRITVVTPSYNQGKFLEETILSVINQDYPNLEYFIVDGGSTDNSVDIIKKYEDKIDWWVSEPDKGQSDAINKGFSRSTGGILAYLNSDDTYVDNALINVGEFFKSNSGVDVFYGNAAVIDDKGRKIGVWKTIKYDFHIHLYGCPIILQPSAFWRRRSFFDTGGLDDNLHFAMDGDLWLRMSKSGAKFYYSDIILSNFRVHNQSKSVATKKEQLIESLSVRQRTKGNNFTRYDKYVITTLAKLKMKYRRLKIDIAAMFKSIVLLKPKLTPDQVKRFFDSDSIMFAENRWLGSQVARQDFKITRQFLLDFLDIGPQDNVLEVGCGPGIWTDIISCKCHHITAIDISGDMIKQAKNRVKNNNITFLQTDFVKYKDHKTYNKLFSVRVIEYFPDPMQVVKKMHTLTEEGGRTVIITKTVPTVITVRAWLWWYFKNLFMKKKRILSTARAANENDFTVQTEAYVFKNGLQ